MAVEDYADAWTAERGRCFRLVYGTDDPQQVKEPA
jgi:hypothetical protein